MINIRTSLKKKLILLALLPAVAGLLLSAILASRSSQRATVLVRDGLSNFMIMRTERSLTHGDALATVVLDAVRRELDSDARLADQLLAARGGLSISGTPVPHQAASDPEHLGGTLLLPPLHIGKESVSQGRSEFVQEIAEDTGALVVLFQRVGETGELVRISANLPSVPLNTFLTDADQATGGAPARTVLAGRSFSGRTLEADGWHIGVYRPLWGSKGAVEGALYIGVPTSGMADLRDALVNNNIGQHGSVALLYGHGPQRGHFLEEPNGIAAETKSQWLPMVLAASTMGGGDQRKVDVQTVGNRDVAIVRFGYLPALDWYLVTVADLRDLNATALGVTDEFRSLRLYALLAYLILLAAVVWIALYWSKLIVLPLQEIAIQLSANGTQVASSVNQQIGYATNFNVSSTEIATAVKQISATSQELVRTMEELSGETAQVSTSAQEGVAGLRGLAGSNATLMHAAHAIGDSFNEIRTRAEKINTVTLAVTRVADHTNLLSLNAAIEAEKAGEVGAGFKVVAREIRRLADQSGKASQEIEGTIQEIQTAMAAGLEEVRGLVSAVEQRVAFAERMLPLFEKILARVEAMPSRYEIVHIGMQNQSEGAKQISEAMWQLTEAAGQTSEATDELKEVSLALHRAVTLLKRRMFEGDTAGSPMHDLVGEPINPAGQARAGWPVPAARGDRT